MLLANHATPGTRNAIRTTVHRLWLAPLVRTDPDAVYFCSTRNALTPEQKRLLQDLARVCNFKATSDLPQWLTGEEKNQLRAFLEDQSAVQPAGRYQFQIGNRLVDFSSAVGLPRRAKGIETVLSLVVGWLGNQPWALKLLDEMGKRSLKKMIGELQAGVTPGLR
ncbi:MAG: hypothetical protein HFACDABA_01077 [Anaerolineales bacterium]|nr:hypothetical protein [Anaerolineales bacterium]